MTCIVHSVNSRTFLVRSSRPSSADQTQPDFNFTHTTVTTVWEVTGTLRNSSVFGMDTILLARFKASSSEPASKVINASFDLRLYPAAWESTKSHLLYSTVCLKAG